MPGKSEQRVRPLRLHLEHAQALDAGERLRQAYDLILRAAGRAQGDECGGRGLGEPDGGEVVR